jgi:hypothetical protein
MLPLLLAPTAWHPPAHRPAGRCSCTAVQRTSAARMEGPYTVEVLPPVGDDTPLPKGTALGEESVGIVFELVFRDIKMLSRTALQRPWPVVVGLAQERLDMVVWFAKYKADQCNLRLHDEVARNLEPLPAPRRVKSLLTWHRARLKSELDDSRSDLWPTLRVLLQRPSMHERIVLAARSQALQFKQSAIPGKRRLTLLRLPRRALSLWFAFWHAWLYGLRWVLVEVARRASLFADVWQPARTRLIEEALVHGVECGNDPSPPPAPCNEAHRRRPVLCLRLQRRVEQIEVVQPFQPSLLPSKQGGAPRPLSAALSSTRRWTSWFKRWPLRPLPG